MILASNPSYDAFFNKCRGVLGVPGILIILFNYKMAAAMDWMDTIDEVTTVGAMAAAAGCISG